MDENVKKILERADEDGRYDIDYIKPERIILKRTEEKGELGRTQYIIQDLDDDDYGGVKVSVTIGDSCIELNLSWRTGRWTADGVNVLPHDIPKTLLDRLYPLDTALSVSTSDRQRWRRAIGLMEGCELSDDDLVVFAEEFCGREDELFPWPAKF